MKSIAARYAILGLVGWHDEGIHGYAAKAKLDALLGEAAFATGRVYQILARLEGWGLVEATEVPRAGRPTRRVFRITPRGRRRLDAWLRRRPGATSGELSVRLVFLAEARREEVITLLAARREACHTRLVRLAARRTSLGDDGPGSLAARLLVARAEVRVRGDLAWLGLVEETMRATPENDLREARRAS